MDSKHVLAQLDRAHLVEMTRDLADIVTITGEEAPVAEYLGREFERLGMEVEYQEVEEGRPNVIGTLRGSGEGPALMFNGHMDHFDNPEPTRVTEDRVYGRGLVNMKCAFPCYITAVDMLVKGPGRSSRATSSSPAWWGRSRRPRSTGSTARATVAPAWAPAT